jgi:hypothetical protein
MILINLQIWYSCQISYLPTDISLLQTFFWIIYREGTIFPLPFVSFYGGAKVPSGIYITPLLFVLPKSGLSMTNGEDQYNSGISMEEITTSVLIINY